MVASCLARLPLLPLPPSAKNARHVSIETALQIEKDVRRTASRQAGTPLEIERRNVTEANKRTNGRAWADLWAICAHASALDPRPRATHSLTRLSLF